MTDSHQSREQDPNQTPSRRRFVQWIGQITAGAAVVGLGLGLTHPKTASAMPECINCVGCFVISCEESGTCRYGDPYKPILVTYGQYYGCVSAGEQCPYYTLHACEANCSISC